MFKKLKKVFQDTLIVSKVTNTENKKLIIFLAVSMAQLIALLDIIIILFFTYLITGTLSVPTVLYKFKYLFDLEVLLPILIILRYSFQYFQSMILRNMELNVNKNLKKYLLEEIFEQKNYSTADSYFFINTLTTHVAYFYSSVANFMNFLLQAIAFGVFLLATNLNTITTFLIGIVLLLYPINYLIKKSRTFMEKSYELGIGSTNEIERVVDNRFLIKLLNKEKDEINRFVNTINELNRSVYENYKYTIINSYLPSFITIFILSIITVFFANTFEITLDFLAITLRMFQALGQLANSTNQVVNSHVHLEKFHSIYTNKTVVNQENFEIVKKNVLGSAFEVSNLSFKYLNSDIDIFQDVNLVIAKNSHTLITGPNGSGKSTLLALLAGIHYADKGLVKTCYSKYSYIGPTPLIFNSSLKDNLMYGNDLQISDDEIISEIQKFKLFNEDFQVDLNKKINNKSLSSGQMQKIAFIRALLAKSEVIFLDESTSNLDRNSKNLIFDIFKKQKVTVINSTHEIDSFENFEHHILIEVNEDSRVIKQIL